MPSYTPAAMSTAAQPIITKHLKILLLSCLIGLLFLVLVTQQLRPTVYTRVAGNVTCDSQVLPSLAAAAAAASRGTGASRGSGRSDSKAAIGKQQGIIPRIIHQSWKSKTLSPRFKLWYDSWDRCFPGWEHRLWTDEDNRKLIKDVYPWFLGTYDGYKNPIQRADAVRYFYLHHYGGIYADLDAECNKPFPHLLNYSLIFGAMAGSYGGYTQPEGYVENSFMAASPGHPFWLEVIHLLLRKKEGGGIEDTTGPIALAESIHNYRVRLGTQRTRHLKIYKPEFFNPFSWLRHNPHCQSFNKMNRSQLERCKNDYKDSYVIQYHAQSWRYGSAFGPKEPTTQGTSVKAQHQTKKP